ncbi:GNAT family N-acetyltransferase [Nocardia sp. NPDC057455]|uniref:GNAT family N-acetyltransferase n=1 Tax=Nocardia sp. NPDC057455 TaxID=3346138 RepID=UPI003671652F
MGFSLDSSRRISPERVQVLPLRSAAMKIITSHIEIDGRLRTSSRGTAQLFRVYVRPEHHRRGPATRSVRAAIDYGCTTTEFDRLYPHTDARTPGALDFWLTFGRILHDARGPHTGFQTVHLEIPLPRPHSGSGSSR